MALERKPFPPAYVLEHRFRKHLFLPLKIQPSEEMTVGHSKFLPLKIQPSEEMTVGHSKILPLKIQPSEGMAW